jgi:hypothetical protein
VNKWERTQTHINTNTHTHQQLQMTTRRISYCRFSLQLIQVPSNMLVLLHLHSKSISLSLSMLNIQIKQHSFHWFLFQLTNKLNMCCVEKMWNVLCCVVLCCVVTFPSSVLSRILDIPKSYMRVYVFNTKHNKVRECV